MRPGEPVPTSAMDPLPDVKPGGLWQPRAMVAHPRVFRGRAHAMGVSHNTNDHDLHSLYYIVRLATRSAIRRRIMSDYPADADREVIFVELGSWCGESALITGLAYIETVEELEALDEPPELQLNCVDTFSGTTNDLSGDFANAYGGSLREMCADNLYQLGFLSKRAAVYVEIHEGLSVESAAKFDDNSVDFVFVDADHSHSACTADINAWFPKVAPGGYIAGHDYNAELFQGVIVAVDQCAQRLARSRPLAPLDSTVWFFRKPPLPEENSQPDAP